MDLSGSIRHLPARCGLSISWIALFLPYASSAKIYAKASLNEKVGLTCNPAR